MNSPYLGFIPVSLASLISTSQTTWFARIKVTGFAGSECAIRIVREQPGWFSIRIDQRDQRTAFRFVQKIAKSTLVLLGTGRQPLPYQNANLYPILGRHGLDHFCGFSR